MVEMREEEGESHVLQFFLNGRRVAEKGVKPDALLIDYLRTTAGLTGTKLGCGEGGCGACTVLLSHFDSIKGGIIHRTANSCLVPLCVVHGMAVTTVEGIGNLVKGMHPVQKRLADLHGSQCGYCTPGIVMQMYGLLKNTEHPTMSQIEENFDGNLCRCTGYRPIFDAFKTFASDADAPWKSPCSSHSSSSSSCSSSSNSSHAQNGNGNSHQNGNGNSHCQNQSSCTPKPKLDIEDCGITCITTQNTWEHYQQQDDITELDFSFLTKPPSPLTINVEGRTWHSVSTLSSLLEEKKNHPEARIVVGNTEIGVETKFKTKKLPPSKQLYCAHVPELRKLEVQDQGIVIGGGATLTELKQFLSSLIDNKLKEHQTHNFHAILKQLKLFAGTQIRNMACVAGNIITASPISDLNSIFIASGSVFSVISLAGQRDIEASNFFVGYRKVDLLPSEVLLSIYVPFTQPLQYFNSYKQSKRVSDDISIVTASFGIQFVEKGASLVISSLSAAFGGMGPSYVKIPKTAEIAIGREWSQETADILLETLPLDLKIAENAPGGMVPYRRTLSTSFFFRFLVSVNQQLSLNSGVYGDSAIQSVSSPLYHGISHGTQEYPKSKNKVVGVGKQAMWADRQATGTAMYVDDTSSQSKDVLKAALVWTRKGPAKVKSIDYSEALASEGVIGIVDSNDISKDGSNWIGEGVKLDGLDFDEEIFVTAEAHSVGQFHAAIIADTKINAQRAVLKVKIEYEESPGIYSIEEAIKAKSFYETLTIKRGDSEKAFESAEHIIEGDIYLGGQEHFYLETHGSLAISEEDRDMTVVSSTQHPTGTQFFVARTLGIPLNRVNVKTKRIGGGFGGKQTRSFALSCAVAVASKKFRRPVSISLDRDEDMIHTGTRHPFYAKYKVGTNKEGVIVAMHVHLYNNVGYSRDASLPVMSKALLHLDNAYFTPNITFLGTLCRTNLPSNTAFRGFGCIQGMFFCETIMDHIARSLGHNVNLVREINLYQHSGQTTPCEQAVEPCSIRSLWSGMIKDSDFTQREKAVREFNSKNRWRKRGISIIPVKYGVAFEAKFMNQASAVVNIYQDGSVVVHHGGVEMGQGLYTKVIQVAAEVLEVPYELVTTHDTSTNNIPNTFQTAGSMGSDLNGMAAYKACLELKQRLDEWRKTRPDLEGAPWPKVAFSAFMDRVNLACQAFYAVPGIEYDMESGKGTPFSYFTTGVACSEIELDVLTGTWRAIRSDVEVDLGQSLNAALDIGQIEGAFIQGMGLWTMEELMWGCDKGVTWIPKGQIFAVGPSTYKIPGFEDVPIDFRVKLTPNSSNPKAVFSSKAVGEPPLFLSASVYHAIKDAIYDARKEEGLTGYFQLNSPATCERIRMACQDKFTAQATNNSTSYVPAGCW